MKRDIAILVLFFYLFALVKPITPVVQDFIAHTLWKMEHVATVHYENGKYHLHSELKDKTSKEESRSTPNSCLKAMKDISLHIVNNLVTSLPLDNCNDLSFAEPNKGLEGLFIQEYNLPPEGIVIS